jgi:hypothetical protein
MRINLRSDVEGRRLKMTVEAEESLVEIKFQCPRAMLDEFELWCKEHHLDFDTTIQKMIDIELDKYRKELDKE